MAEIKQRNGKQIIARFLRNALFAVVLAFTVVYLIDYLVLRIRIATGGNAIGQVTVHPVYAVPHKDHRIEYSAGDPEQQSCVHSLFPHLGDTPCWYLDRHTEQQIDM